MPFKSISELPKAVKDKLSEKLQKVWKDVFNRVWDDNSDLSKDKREKKAAATAWKVVNKKRGVSQKNSKSAFDRVSLYAARTGMFPDDKRLWYYFDEYGRLCFERQITNSSNN